MRTDAHPGTVVWRKSTRSPSQGECVEVAFLNGQGTPVSVATVLVRDSKYLRDPANDPAQQPTIAIDARQWPSFLALVLGDGTAGTGLPQIQRRNDGGTTIHSGDVSLAYTPGEWAAFVAGVQTGEFELPAPVLAA